MILLMPAVATARADNPDFHRERFDVLDRIDYLQSEITGIVRNLAALIDAAENGGGLDTDDLTIELDELEALAGDGIDDLRHRLVDLIDYDEDDDDG
jgi:hypothetical protein